MALVVLGVVFVAISARPPRSSALGIAAGVLLVLAGLVRVLRSRRDIDGHS
jgi:hypothetical protein